MIIIISSITILVISFFIAKRVIIKRLQIEYERSLLKGNKKRAVQLGKMYYMAIDEAARKAKGIIDIEAKISDDFRAFNGRHFSILF